MGAGIWFRGLLVLRLHNLSGLLFREVSWWVRGVGIYWFQRAMMRCHRYVDAQWIRYVSERNTFRPSVQEDWIGNDGCEVKVMQKFPKMIVSDDRVVESSVVCRIFNPFYEFISQSFVLQRIRHLSAIEKKIFGKNIICKTSEGATRSRTKSRGANPASRPSARTDIQTENSTLSNRVFFCIIILLRTLVSLPFLHTILLWYFFVLSWFFQRFGVLNLRVCAGRWFRKFSRFFDFWEVLGDASRGSLIFQCFGFFEFVCLFALGDASRGCRGSSIFHGFSILKTAATKPARTISLSSPRQSLDPWPLEHWKIKEPRQPGDHHPEQTNARIQNPKRCTFYSRMNRLCTLSIFNHWIC